MAVDTEKASPYTEDLKQIENVTDTLHNNDLAYKGDDSDGKVVWTFRTVVALACLAALYAASQMVLCFVGGSIAYITPDLKAEKLISWLPVSNTLAIASVAPFAGYLQDLFGRRYITLIGSVLVMIGLALTGSAHGFTPAVAGMSICGAGAAISELTALAGISDIVPVRYRGVSMALMVSFLIPFTPYVLYCQLLSTRASWRWTIWLTLIYNAIIFLGILTTYFPKAHPRMEGLKKRDILKQIDYVGAILSIVGTTLLLVALQGGGYTHPWKSAYILAQLIIGIFLMISFIIWEWKICKAPMVPHALFEGQRTVALAFIVAFVAGLNFYSTLNFFPVIYSSLYEPDPIQIGLKGLGYGISVTAGAVFFNALLSIRNLHCKYVIGSATVLMTAFGGALAVANPDNPKLTVALGTVAGFGVGGILVPAATLALIVVPDSLLATTAALSLSIRTIGGSIGNTIYYNIFTNKLAGALPEYVVNFAVGAGLPLQDAEGFVTTFLTAPQDITSFNGATPAVIQAATIGTRWAYALALKYVWYASIPFGILAIISAMFLQDIKRFQTNRIAVTL